MFTLEGLIDPERQVRALHDLARALAGTGKLSQAAKAASLAWKVAQSIEDAAHRNSCLPRVAEIFLAAGQDVKAEGVARQIADLGWRAHALTAVAGWLWADGQHDRALRIGRDAWTSAGSITDADKRARELESVASRLAASGLHDLAGEVAMSITVHEERVRTLCKVADALASHGDHVQAAQVADHVATIVTTSLYPNNNAYSYVRKLKGVVDTLTSAGSYRRAAEVADHAEAAARTVRDAGQRAHSLQIAAEAFAAAKRYDKATALALSIGDPRNRERTQTHQVDALIKIYHVLTAAGLDNRAATVARHAEKSAISIDYVSSREDALGKLSGTLAAAKQVGGAEATAKLITDPSKQARALESAMEAAMATGQYDRAKLIAQSISDPRRQAQIFAKLAVLMHSAGQRTESQGILAASWARGHWSTPLARDSSKSA